MPARLKHIFAKGQSSDLEDLIKSKDTFVLGLNGRLFAGNETISYTSLDGTEKVYENTKIAKYLGYEVFKDQIVLFVKCSGVDVNIGGIIYETQEVDVLIAKDFSVDLISSEHDFTNEFTDNSIETTYTENISTPAPLSEIDFDDNYAPDAGSEDDIDFDSYYSSIISLPNFKTCPVNAAAIPPNNTQYADCIITLQYNDVGVFYDRMIWSGYQNWPVNGKIIALGLEENSNYRRIYYTDNVTTFKSINTLDSGLFKRSAKELSNFQSSTLLQPRIVSVDTDGQLKSMAVQYYYRLITENGQTTEFSVPSEMIFIYPEDNTAFRGGYAEEITNKAVTFQCNVIDADKFYEIEVVAVEFEAKGLPTAIKSIATQRVSKVNVFRHLGSEPDFGDNVNISDLLASKNNWKYCSDLATKNNKLFAAGLRNDPLASDFKELKYNFALHGWSSTGATHDTFINPDPVTYNKTPIGYTGDMFYVNKRLYRSIKVFQNATVSLENLSTGQKISTDVVSAANFYVDHTENLSTWLLSEQSSNANFSTYFPNLTIEFTDNVILLKPTDDNINTNFNNYKMTYNITQVVDDFEDEIVFNDESLPPATLIDGAMTAGFNSGNGLRITFRLVEEEICTKATSRFNGVGKIVDFKDPTFNRTFFKGEIYRLGINFYADGERLFAIPMGDLKIPDIGDTYQYLDDTNNLRISTDKYLNQKVVGNKLYGLRVEMRIEFRLDCRFSEFIDSYKLVHVERTDQNRTIVAQGIAAPLMRLQDPFEFLAPGQYILDERLRQKWMLPYYGGPTYDKEGLDVYDDEGGEYSTNTYDWRKRTIHDRRLFYFDSPDMIYGVTSESLIGSSKIEIVGRVNTDHTPNVIMESGEAATTDLGDRADMASFFGQEVYPKFSRKILHSELKTIEEAVDFPHHVRDAHADDHTIQSQFVNVSVFSNFSHYNAEHLISGSESMDRGEITSGSTLNSSFEISNNAMCLPYMPWWYSKNVRAIEKANDQHKYEAMLASNISVGEKTVFIKAETDVFTNDFIGLNTLPTPSPQIANGDGSTIDIYDSHAIINIKRNNQNSVYGGRTELAFSKNVFVALSETKPVNDQNNGAQVFNVQGDAYVTLYLRTKNSHGDSEEERADRNINNGRGNGTPDNYDLEEVYKLNGAWCYGVVLESMIEPKLNDEYEFYRETSAIDFGKIKGEVLNGAYLNRDNYKEYIPQSFRFKDDPLFTNIVAASKTKLSGEYYDAWSEFPVNEFQELDKNKGAVFNLVKFKNEIFAIQERQTNLLHIDRDTMIPTDSGEINVKQGSGKSIDGYKVISPYGTAIRRSIVEHDIYGFSFIDETLKLFVKIDRPITIENQYHHDFFNSLKSDPIVDIENFFDEQYKDSCFLIRQKSGAARVFSYNEVLKVINGYYEMEAPLFISFGDSLFAPVENTFVSGETTIIASHDLHRMNTGEPLKFFGENKKMVITIISGEGIDIVALFNHISLIIGHNTTWEKIDLETKSGLTRTVTPDHPRFSNKEGIHSVPLMNEWYSGISNDETKKLRGEWVKVKVTFPFTGTKQKITSIIINDRKSYI